MKRRIATVLAAGMVVGSIGGITPSGAGETEPEVTKLTVTASDYAFDLPETLPEGQYQFKFYNSTKKTGHEMFMFRRKDSTPVKKLLKMPFRKLRKKIATTAWRAAGPGKTRKAFNWQGWNFNGPPPTDKDKDLTPVDLTPGRYVALCFFQDGKKKPPHFALGMLSKVRVEEAPAPE